jgi:hypothetical protein
VYGYGHRDLATYELDSPLAFAHNNVGVAGLAVIGIDVLFLVLRVDDNGHEMLCVDNGGSLCH